MNLKVVIKQFTSTRQGNLSSKKCSAEETLECKAGKQLQKVVNELRVPEVFFVMLRRILCSPKMCLCIY